MKRLLRRLLTCSLIALILLQLGYLSRGWWLEPWIKARVSAALEQALDAEVRIGAIGGNWLTSIRLRDVRIDSPGLTVSSAEARLRLSPWTLVRRGLAGCDRAEITASRVVLDPVTVGTKRANSQESAQRSLSDLPLEIFPNGATISVAECVLLAPAPEAATNGANRRAQAAPLTVQLEPLAARQPALANPGRALQLRYAGIRTTATVTPIALSARIQASGVDSWLTWWSGDPRWAGGELSAQVQAEENGRCLEARGTLRVAQLAHGGRTFDRSRLHWRTSKDTLRVDHGHFALPGLTADVSGLMVPFGSITTATAADIRGDVAVVIPGDRDALRALLPDHLARWADCKGTIRLSIDADRLKIERGRLRAPGIRVDLERGSLPWPGSTARSRGQVVFSLIASEVQQLDGLPSGSLAAKGQLRGVVRGTLSDCTIDTRAELEAVSTPWASARALTARMLVHWPARRIDVRRLIARDVLLDSSVRPGTAVGPTIQPDELVDATGSLSVDFNGPRVGVEPDLQLTLPDQWPHALGASNSLADRFGPAQARIRGAIRQAEPEAVSSPWIGHLETRLQNLVVDDAPPLSLHVRVEADPDGAIRVPIARSRGAVVLDATAQSRWRFWDQPDAAVLVKARGDRLDLDRLDRWLAPVATITTHPDTNNAASETSLASFQLELAGPAARPELTLQATAALDDLARWVDRLGIGGSIALSQPAQAPTGWRSLLAKPWQTRVNVQTTPDRGIRLDGSLQAVTTGSNSRVQLQAHLPWAFDCTRSAWLRDAPIPGIRNLADARWSAQGDVQLTGHHRDARSWTLTARAQLDEQQLSLDDLKLDAPELQLTGSARWRLPIREWLRPRPSTLAPGQRRLSGRLRTGPNTSLARVLTLLDQQDADLATAVRNAIPPELQSAQFELDLGVGGTLRRPTWTTTATGRWADLRPLIERVWATSLPDVEPTLPATPVPGSIALRGRLDRALQIERLIARVGQPATSAHAELAASGRVRRGPAGTWTLADLTQLDARLVAEFFSAEDLAGGIAIDAGLVATRSSTRLDLGHVTIGRATATGNMAADAPFDQVLEAWRSDSSAGAAAAKLSGAFRLDAFDPGPIIESFANLQAAPNAAPLTASGILDGSGEFGGTIGAPHAVATLRLRDGTLKASGLPRLQRLGGILRSSESGVELERLTGESGAGRFELIGYWRSPDPKQSPWSDWKSSRVRLQLSGRDVLLTRNRGIKLRVHPQVVADGTPERLTVRGEIAIASGKFVRHISLLPDLGNQGSAAIETRAPWLVRVPEPFGSRLWFEDVNLRTERSFEVRTDVIACDLDTTAQLRGPGNGAWLVGVVNGTNATLDLPGAALDIETMLLRFDGQQPGQPEIQLSGSGRRHGIELRLAARGGVLDPEITLTSDPPLPREDLVVLATTGTLPSRLRELGSRGQSVLLGWYLAQELRAIYFGSESTERGRSVFDRLSFSSGREISDRGVESLELEFELGKRVYLHAERDVYEDYNMGLGYRLRF